MRHSSTYREIALAFAEQPSEAAKFDQIVILLEILVMLPLANAVSEGGLSLQSCVKTDKRNRMHVDTTLGAKIRCAELGPTDGKEIGMLVDRAVPLVFSGAMPNRSAGAHAANAVQMLAKAQRSKAAPSAQSIIAGDGGTAHQDDGTSASTAANLAPFPFDKYEANLTMPALDRALVGK